MSIKHLWFDFSETIAHINKFRHDELKYEEYARATNREVTNQLKQEFEELYIEHNHSISDIFYSLGAPSGYWSNKIATVEPSELFTLADESIPSTLTKLSDKLPISIFSNIDLDGVLESLNINDNIFTYIISSKMVGKPKPALDGFNKMIELSGVPANEILYIGDNVGKDILPAKEVGIIAGIIWDSSDEADVCFNSFDDILDYVENNS